MADMQWTGRVGRDKLDLYFFAFGGVALTKTVTCCDDVIDDV